MSSSLFLALHQIVDRVPWHSEVQHQDVMDLVRQAETDVRGDSIDAEAPAVVPPKPAVNEATDPGMIAANANQQLDYSKLADAIVAAQQVQQAQAAAAVAAAPGFETPGAENVPPAESHAAVS